MEVGYLTHIVFRVLHRKRDTSSRLSDNNAAATKRESPRLQYMDPSSKSSYTVQVRPGEPLPCVTILLADWLIGWLMPDWLTVPLCELRRHVSCAVSPSWHVCRCSFPQG
jgi:hypothetical protein